MGASYTHCLGAVVVVVLSGGLLDIGNAAVSEVCAGDVDVGIVEIGVGKPDMGDGGALHVSEVSSVMDETSLIASIKRPCLLECFCFLAFLVCLRKYSLVRSSAKYE